MMVLISRMFYALKPMIPRSLQLYLRRLLIRGKLPIYKDKWPILINAGKKPSFFKGWPDSKGFAVVLTHDVELIGGVNKVMDLLDLEKSMGFRSSFNFVPERYEVIKEVRDYVQAQGFEVGVHGLNHDGKLFQSSKIFQARAKKINSYLKEWNAIGFRSPAMHHNLEWIKKLNIQYDLSTFDTDPFEPQSDAVETIFPFWVGDAEDGYVELPYTLPQDFTLFVLMQQPTIEIWKKKLDWVVSKEGMALINVHPDYLAFNQSKQGMEEFPVAFYEEFLNHIKTQYKGRYWNPLPTEIAAFWKHDVLGMKQGGAIQ